jgi:Rrf2 family protein
VSSNSRYSVALHALLLLTDAGDDWVTSEWIAGSVKTNPVVIRRILARLMEAGLVLGAKGAGGGYRLARPAKRITLWDVYLALRETGPFGLHANPPNPHCPIGACIEKELGRIYDEAEGAMAGVLGSRSLHGLRRTVMAGR